MYMKNGLKGERKKTETVIQGTEWNCYDLNNYLICQCTEFPRKNKVNQMTKYVKNQDLALCYLH